MANFRRLILVGVLAALIISCGGKAGAKREEVVFWHSFVAATHPALEKMLADFESSNPGIRIKPQYVPTGDALVQKLITSISSGTAPDIAWIHADFLSKLAEADAIFPVDHFAEAGLDLDDFFPALLEGGKWGGELYAVPMEATSLAIVYNKDLFARAGLNHPPATWEELRDYANVLTQDTDGDGKLDQYGFYVPNFPASGNLSVWMNLQFQPYLWQAGGSMSDPATGRVTFNSPAGVAALEYWKTLFDELEMKTFSLSHDLGFTSQNLAMVMDGPWDLPAFRKIEDFEWAVAPMPAGPAGSATYLAGEYLVVFRQADYPERAWEFIQWFTSPETQAEFSSLSGYLPVRKSTLEIDSYRSYLDTNPALKAFIDQIPDARRRPMFDAYNTEINQALAEAIEKVLLDKQGAREALDEAAEKCNRLLGG